MANALGIESVITTFAVGSVQVSLASSSSSNQLACVVCLSI